MNLSGVNLIMNDERQALSWKKQSGYMISSDGLFFFDEKPAAIPLYEAFAKRILAEIDNVTVKVQKTQISFSNKYYFAFVSLLPVRKAKERPETWITVTFGLRYKKESPRIDVASEPYPNRWTHHMLISSVDEIDDELMGWIKEAAAFSTGKR